MSHFFIKAAACGFAIVLTGLSACSDKVIVEDATPFGSEIKRLGDTAIAEVDGTRIYLSDVERHAEAQGLIEPGDAIKPGMPAYNEALEELVDQRLLALEAIKRSLDQTDENRRRLALARERLLGNMLLESHLAQNVNDAAILRMFDEQVDLMRRGDEVRARHLVVATREEVEAARTRILSGEAFESVATEVSLDTNSGSNGGDLGYFAADMREYGIVRAAFSTPTGEISPPFETESGWHIVKVEDRRVAARPSFEAMKPEIAEFLTFEEIQSLLVGLRTSSDIRRLDSNIPDLPVVDQPEDEGEDI